MFVTSSQQRLNWLLTDTVRNVTRLLEAYSKALTQILISIWWISLFGWAQSINIATLHMKKFYHVKDMETGEGNEERHEKRGIKEDGY